MAPSLGDTPTPFLHAVLTQQPIHFPAYQKLPRVRLRGIMDKSNIAFALITSILGLYICVALLLSRVRGAGKNKTRPADQAHDGHKRSRLWT
jgi:hypothetical protein